MLDVEIDQQILESAREAAGFLKGARNQNRLLNSRPLAAGGKSVGELEQWIGGG